MASDVLVIGGGPAGLSAAIAARCKGFSVTLIDAACPPIDKACGECVLPAGVEALRRIGVGIAGLPVRGIRFVDQGTRVEATFPGGAGIAVRRTCLHKMLTDRASELGVRLRWGTRLDTLEAESYGWLIGADGQNSRVRREAGLDAGSYESSRYGFRRHYRVRPWTECVEVHWGSRCQIYVTPAGCDEIGIALLTRQRHLRIDAALAEFPELHRRLRRREVSSADRGAATVSRRLRSVYSGRTVLVGDASGSVDAITGDGLSLAFRQSCALAESLVSGRLHEYEAEHGRMARHAARFATLLLTMDRQPVLRWCAIKTLSWQPGLFARLLASHLDGSAAPPTARSWQAEAPAPLQ